MKENLYFKRDTLKNEVETLTLYRDLLEHKYKTGNELATLNQINASRESAAIRKGLYDDLLYPQLFDLWKDTFFVNHRIIAEKLASSTLSQKHVQELKERQRKSIFMEPYQYETFVVWIEAMIPTPQGNILKLTDPFGSLYTKPLSNAFFDDKGIQIDRIAVATIGFSHITQNEHPVESLTILPYTIS